jgi:hypothetical protein
MSAYFSSIGNYTSIVSTNYDDESKTPQSKVIASRLLGTEEQDDDSLVSLSKLIRSVSHSSEKTYR